MEKLMTKRFLIPALLSTLIFSTPAMADEKFSLAKGAYRLEGKCERTFYLGASTAPKCASHMGITVKDPAAPMFIFPLQDGAWFFVASNPIETTGTSSARYALSKLFDESLGAEFRYPAGECEITDGPKVRCTVWKDKERTTIARELSFSGSGNWLFSRD